MPHQVLLLLQVKTFLSDSDIHQVSSFGVQGKADHLAFILNRIQVPGNALVDENPLNTTKHLKHQAVIVTLFNEEALSKQKNYFFRL